MKNEIKNKLSIEKEYSKNGFWLTLVNQTIAGCVRTPIRFVTNSEIRRSKNGLVTKWDRMAMRLFNVSDIVSVEP